MEVKKLKVEINSQDKTNFKMIVENTQKKKKSKLYCIYLYMYKLYFYKFLIDVK